jgi:hypothetical protein
MNETTVAPAPTESTPALLPAVIPPPETVQTRSHHKYGPSKMNYLDDCAGFTSRSGTSEAAEQGTFLHGLMEDMIALVNKGAHKTTLEQVAAWLTKKHELTDEEIDYLRFCCKRVDTFLARKPTAVITEISVSVTHPDGTELNRGFLDVLYVFSNVGIVQDFKFGQVPVRPASDNLQGINYALGCFLKYRNLDRIGVEFVQPKLNWVTSKVFERRDIHALYTRLAEVIERAEFVKANPQDAQRYMKPGHYCQYCALAGGCTVLSNHRAIAATRYAGLPTPPSFKGLELTKPEDVALARYWVDIIESGLDEIKARAFEIAETNGGEIHCTLPDGTEVHYEVQERSADRVLGSAPEVAEALKEFCSPEEILGAAKLALGKLETIAKNALVEVSRARGEKLTKKAAWEQTCSTLEAHGLLSRPDYKIRFLKQKKEVTKQIEKV